MRRIGLVLGTLLLAACSASSSTSVASSQTPSSVVSSTTSTTTTSTTTTTTTTVPSALDCIAGLDPRVKLGQLLLPIISQSGLSSVRDLVSTGAISGVALVQQLDARIGDELAEIHALAPAGFPLIVAVDEEGGRVQRLADVLGRLDSAGQVAATGDPEVARALALERALQLAELGFTMNLAPVADLADGGYIGDRSFGDDPELVAQFVLASIEGIAEAGLVPVAKHFPGHGSASDSHRSLPVTNPIAEIRQRDLVPFEAVVSQAIAGIMVGHLDVPGLTDGVPATVSSAAITGLLRNEMGHEGLVITDALNMGAITDGLDIVAAVEVAIVAGADLVLVPGSTGVDVVTDRLLDAVAMGRLSTEQLDRSVERILVAKRVDPCAVTQ